jgi:hypothetical protein
MTKTLNQIFFFPSTKIRIFFLEKNKNVFCDTKKINILTLVLSEKSKSKDCLSPSQVYATEVSKSKDYLSPSQVYVTLLLTPVT